MSRQTRSLKSLLDMGCDPYLSTAAIYNCDRQNLRTLLQWIIGEVGNESKWKKWLKDKNISEHTNSGGWNHLVDEQMEKEIMRMGYSKAVAQKSLLLTNNVSVQSALEWIHEHRNDEDFEKEIISERQMVPQLNLTYEEAKIKLEELIKKAKEIRTKRCEEEQVEKSVNIKRYGRPIVWAKRIAEQQSLRKKLRLYQTSNKKDIECQAKLLQRLRNQRFQSQTNNQEEKESHLKEEIDQNFLSQLQIQCKQVQVAMLANPLKAKILFETVGIYINNIILKSEQQKFKKINMENKAFKERVLGCFGGLEVLKAIGYEEENNYLVMRDLNIVQLSKAVSVLQRYIQSYS